MPESSSAAPRPPFADRARIPPEYGVADGPDLVDWRHVEERLAAERVYWVVTAGPGCRPRARPVDGLFVDGVIYVGGSPQARWVRDVAANPSVSVHLEGTDDVVIVEGDAEVLSAVDDGLAGRLAAASNAKFPEYGTTAADYQGGGVVAIRPRIAIAWTEFGRNPTRFRFED